MTRLEHYNMLPGAEAPKGEPATVRQLLFYDLFSGKMSFDQLLQEFNSREWPNYETYEPVDDDPNSFFLIDWALEDQVITEDERNQLMGIVISRGTTSVK
jgi:hypothetical protein